MRPSYKRPYYYIHNVNSIATQTEGGTVTPINPLQTKGTSPTNELKDHASVLTAGLGEGTDAEHIKTISNDNSVTFTGGLSRSLLQSGDLVEKHAAVRYGNASTARIEIRYGKDASLFELENVYIDYIKTPQHIRLTQEELDLTEDHSQMMEFPDYVCQEIINELVKLVMENAGDPRLQSNIAVNQSIANPAQQ